MMDGADGAVRAGGFSVNFQLSFAFYPQTHVFLNTIRKLN